MKRLPPILILTVAAFALATPVCRANFEGRLGQMAEDAIASTRVMLPIGGTVPPQLVATPVPDGVLPRVTPVLAVLLPPVSIVSVPALMVATVPPGPSDVISVPGLAAVGVPPGPSDVISVSGLAAVGVPPGPSGLIPVLALGAVTVPDGSLVAVPALAAIVDLLPPPAKSAPRAWVPRKAPPLLTPVFAALAAARLVRDGLADGTLDPLNPAWRPHLARILASTTYSMDSEALFANLLVGCTGNDDRARLDEAEAWANAFEGGRYAPTIAYYAARRTFTSGNYDETALRCERLIAKYPEATDSATLLLALAQAQGVDRSRALQTLRNFRKLHPESPAANEAHFMEAWIALQDSRKQEASTILREIVAKSPRTPAAAKATQMLASIEGVK